MLAHQYQVWPKFGWGDDQDPDDPIEKRLVGITTLAKRDREAPYEVFNELVAMRLGQLVGLPVPPGVIVERVNKPYFCSCHVSAAHGELPQCNFPKFVAEKEDDACGVVVFDAWIGNTDRHDDNIWYDYYGDRFFLFDHGRSLLGTAGRQNLANNRTSLAIRLEPPCLRDHLVSFAGFWHWHERILAVPDYAIRQAVRDAASLGVDLDHACECGEWLLNRRQKLPELFRDNLTIFPKYRPSMLDPFRNNRDISPEYYI